LAESATPDRGRIPTGVRTDNKPQLTLNPSTASTASPRPPRPAAPIWENFPVALTTLPRWVAWLYLYDVDRWTKVPFQPGGRKASVTDPATWASFEHVQCAYYSPCDMGKIPFDGVGFVLGPPFCGFDFDKCRNPATGEIDPLIASYVARLDSYTEVSPSGTGLRVIVEATLPPRDRRLGGIEMYDARRFVSLTGHLLLDTSS